VDWNATIARRDDVMKKKPKTHIDYPNTGFNVRPEGLVNTDPFGSYTGRGNDPYEKPVQDADDL